MKLLRRTGKNAFFLAFLLHPSFAIIDWLLYPDKWLELAFVRVIVAVFLLLLWTVADRLPDRLFVLTGLFGSLSITYSIVLMTYLVEGAASPYYAFVMLVLVFFSTALPWSYGKSLWVAVMTLLAYALSSYLFAQTEIIGARYWKDFSIHFALLVGASILCVYANVFQAKQRYENFRLQFELKQKNQEAKKLSRIKTEFFSNMSHELRTPLTLILGPIQEMLHHKSTLSDSVQSLLKTANHNGLRLLRLVNDLLDIMKLEEQIPLKAEAIKVTELINALVQSVEYAATSKGIVLRAQELPEETWICADYHAVEKICMNLLSNAIKFTPPKGSIDINYQQKDNVLTIRVSDTGIGISPEHLGHIFERFQQADASTTRHYGGTGIGLALVKELTESMGGKALATSTLGKGTTIEVSLPLWNDSSHTSASPSLQPTLHKNLYDSAQISAILSAQTPETPGQEKAHQDSFETILIVDDEPSMRKYLIEILHKNYNILQAKDGKEGLELAVKEKPELILLDLMLPIFDGLEVCRRLKELEPCLPCKVILLTARVDEEARLTALDNGADDFLTKPFSALELKTRIRNLLKQNRMEKERIQQNKTLNQSMRQLKQTQSQLIQSEKLNALGSLSAGLLHEINNPLNYSMTALHLLKLENHYANDQEFASTIDDIDQGMNRISHIVSDLRAFAYPSEADKMASFSLGAAIQSALRFTNTELRNIKVEKDFVEQDKVQGSRSHIVQVLINLFTNAAKAIAANTEERDPGNIKISTTTCDDKITISICDNGIGMDKATQSQVFDPFFTTRVVGQGVGLGLSVCHTIMNNHDGTLRVESIKDQGSTFSFDLFLDT